MVLVVDVCVFVLHRLVLMWMFMPLGEVHVEAKRDERSRDDKLSGDGVSEQDKSKRSRQ